MSEVKTCCKKIYNTYSSYVCGKKAKFERDGKHYCGMHDPVAVKAKDDARRAKWDAERNAAREAREAPFNRIKELEAELSSLRLKLEECQKDAKRWNKFIELNAKCEIPDSFFDYWPSNECIEFIDEAIRLADKEEK